MRFIWLLVAAVGCVAGGRNDHREALGSVPSTSGKADGTAGVGRWELYRQGERVWLVGVGEAGEPVAELSIGLERGTRGDLLVLESHGDARGRIAVAEGGVVEEARMTVQAQMNLDEAAADFAPYLDEGKADVQGCLGSTVVGIAMSLVGLKVCGLCPATGVACVGCLAISSLTPSWWAWWLQSCLGE